MLPVPIFSTALLIYVVYKAPHQLTQPHCHNGVTVVTVLWIGFYLIGLISLCVDSFMLTVCNCVFWVYLFDNACLSYYCNMVRWTWWDL